MCINEKNIKQVEEVKKIEEGYLHFKINYEQEI